MGMHRDLRMRKVLQATISSSEFISIPTNTKFTKSVRYIHDNKSWERCYILLKILFSSLGVLCLADSNISVMEKGYYYSRMTNQCIEITISDIDYQRLLPYISSPANIYGTSRMTKLIKNSQYQMIVIFIQTISFLSYQNCGMNGRNISILIILWLVGCHA